MNNYLIKSLHKIRQATETFGDSYNNPPTVLDYSGNFGYYEKMQELSIASYGKNLQGDWQLIYLSEEFDSLQDSFRYTFEQTYNLWNAETCNVLYADPDTLCLKPTEIFGGTWSPGSRRNCCLRYFPHDMDTAAWHKAKRFMRDWDYTIYDYEQLMYNAMSAGMPLPNVEDLVQQAPAAGIPGQNNSNVFSRVDYSKNIIHFHSSRDPRAALVAMQNVSYDL